MRHHDVIWKGSKSFLLFEWRWGRTPPLKMLSSTSKKKRTKLIINLVCKKSVVHITVKNLTSFGYTFVCMRKDKEKNEQIYQLSVLKDYWEIRLYGILKKFLMKYLLVLHSYVNPHKCLGTGLEYGLRINCTQNSFTFSRMVLTVAWTRLWNFMVRQVKFNRLL